MDTAAGHRKSEIHGFSSNQLPPAVLLSNTIHKGGCCLLLTAVPSAGLLSSSFLNSQLCRHICHTHPPPPATDLSFPLAFILAYTSLYLSASRFLDLPPLTFFWLSPAYYPYISFNSLQQSPACFCSRCWWLGSEGGEGGGAQSLYSEASGGSKLSPVKRSEKVSH